MREPAEREIRDMDDTLTDLERELTAAASTCASNAHVVEGDDPDGSLHAEAWRQLSRQLARMASRARQAQL
jgi:hypothetical protein